MSEGLFKIGTLAMMTGFGVQTLRNWERRHGLLKPTRVASGHRFYTMDDVVMLGHVRELIDQGRSIGEIVKLVKRGRSKAHAPAPAGSVSPNEVLPYILLDALPCGVVLTDAHGCTEWINKSLERICGYGLTDLRGRTPGSVLQGARTDPRTVRQLAKAVADQQPCSTRILNYAANERQYWADLEIAPLLLGPALRGFVATVRDVTDEVEGPTKQ